MKKAELIEGLRKENRQWLALLDTIGTERMDQPGVSGYWSVKDIIAHITGWRRRTVGRLIAAGRGEPEPPWPWPAHLHTDDEVNGWFYENNHERPVQEILDESEQVFEQILEAVIGLPDEILEDPARHLPWFEGHSLEAADFFAHFHEEHEPDILAWLARIEDRS
jgi:hypothetical protein